MNEQNLLLPQAPAIAAKPVWLGQVAAADPKLAWVLREMGRTSGDLVDCGGLELVPLTASWTSGAANQQVPADTQGIVETELWIRSITYTVRRPLAYAGNIFKGVSDYFNQLQPNIDFTLEIKSYQNYLIATEPTPLETLNGSFNACCPTGLVLRCNSQVKASFTNLRAWADGELPVDASIVLHGLRLPANLYGACNAEAAQALMRELGLEK